jgi:hypothetical protein
MFHFSFSFSKPLSKVKYLRHLMRVADQLHTSKENFFDDGGVSLGSEGWQKGRHPSPPLPFTTMSHHLARD